MIVHVTPSIDRPWSGGGGFYSCPPFPPTVFAELSPSVGVKQVRDVLGRWRSERGVDESMQRAVRCREPHGGEGVLILGGELGV